MKSDEKKMERALFWAERAYSEGEIPVGCVIYKDGRLIAHGYNLREKSGDPTAHAEILAIRSAARRLGSWRLEGCEIFVSLEPCFMCAAAIQQARISRVVFGAYDPKTGALASLCSYFDEFPLNHRAEIRGGVLEEESSELLKRFFRELRKSRS